MIDRRTFLASATGFCTAALTTAMMAPDALADDSASAPLPSKDRYAALSLIGDSLDIVHHRMETGSSLDRNRHESVPVSDGALDKLALLDIGEALKIALPNSSVDGLLASQPSLFTSQDDLFSDKKLLLPDALSQAIKNTGASRLILLTKYRHDTLLRTRNDAEGSGKLQGVGFYVDHWHKMKRGDTGEEGHGFIAPYVYIRVWLVDVPSFSVLGSQEVIAGRAIAAARNEDGFDPWGALSNSQKIGHIQHLMKEELNRVVPVLVASV